MTAPTATPDGSSWSGATADRVALRLVNGFEVLRNEEALELPLTAQRLLAFLAFQERPVQRVYVAGKLWIDTAEERASGSLRSAIWRVKQTEVALIRTPDTRLALDPVCNRTPSCAKCVQQAIPSVAPSP